MKKKRVFVFLGGADCKLSSDEIKRRIFNAVICESFLISSGTRDENYSYVIGLLCATPFNTIVFTKRLKLLFDGIDCKIKAVKGWGPICSFFSERDFLSIGCFSKA